MGQRYQFTPLSIREVLTLGFGLCCLRGRDLKPQSPKLAVPSLPPEPSTLWPRTLSSRVSLAKLVRKDCLVLLV